MAANRLRLVTFDLLSTQARRIGVHVDKQVVDLCSHDSTIPNNMKGFLAGGRSLLEKAAKIVESGKSRISLDQVQIRAPIYDPEKIVCVGLNYRDHAKESNMPIPPEPVLFSKFPSTIIGPKNPIIKPEVTNELDYEVELVVVIGEGGRHIPESSALKHVAGYTVGNDVSARDWQLKKPGGQWMAGKTFDTFAPIGPSILVNPLLLSPGDTFDPNKLGIRCFLNDKKVQDSNTSEFIFNVQQVVAYISRIVTLKPGDLIFTGTPPGVGFGKKPPVYMNVKDKVMCEIDELGSLENHII